MRLILAAFILYLASCANTLHTGSQVHPVVYDISLGARAQTTDLGLVGFVPHDSDGFWSSIPMPIVSTIFWFQIGFLFAIQRGIIVKLAESKP